ncbi:3-hydroxyacyl-CoA dehydrogenase [Blastococcus sp. MG754426]|uniref:3-hydroxyacyl-CoA dehydrogenase n=1 Tax=unclassified Blastococcus TaxID=2619396 RepID=UPI001EF05FFF|nr:MULTISPECIES: 3-hydroxyacyl-CoA dehydrogenase [unclassified Blastococcus]MCF6508105.1 3-hydroxyacyl-CoA dehydrogenase [Blastococcus sp. MG754426]MCF6511566.1 3-hydroxyacyl-CoA dehydrogenase [Blastococcus sp. MG754427]
MLTDGPVAVVGAGSIGVAWAVVVARAGRPVVLHDPDPARLAAVPGEVRTRLEALTAHGLLGEPVATVAGRVRTAPTLADALGGAVHVQECAPEQLGLKQQLFAQLDELAEEEVVLASSSSALTCSTIAGGLPGRGRCLVVHPGNPPYLLPVAEVVPAPFTSAGTVARTRRLLEELGMTPVHVAVEVEGFVFNRLQGALLREAYALVRDGVVSVADVDRVVRDGLGRRWSVIGPFATAELNTRGGIEAHAERMGEAYARMGAERGQRDRWEPELVHRVADELHGFLPPERWEENVARRDAALMALERARRAVDLPGADRTGPAGTTGECSLCDQHDRLTNTSAVRLAGATAGATRRSPVPDAGGDP